MAKHVLPWVPLLSLCKNLSWDFIFESPIKENSLERKQLSKNKKKLFPNFSQHRYEGKNEMIYLPTDDPTKFLPRYTANRVITGDFIKDYDKSENLYQGYFASLSSAQSGKCNQAKKKNSKVLLQSIII